jgi:rubrerythrin
MTYQADGTEYGTMEGTGDTMAVCDVCGYTEPASDGDECPECVAKWEADNA